MEKVPGWSILERAPYHEDLTHIDMLLFHVQVNLFLLSILYFVIWVTVCIYI